MIIELQTHTGTTVGVNYVVDLNAYITEPKPIRYNTKICKISMQVRYITGRMFINELSLYKVVDLIKLLDHNGIRVSNGHTFPLDILNQFNLKRKSVVQ